jgi:hypothetical protein
MPAVMAKPLHRPTVALPAQLISYPATFPAPFFFVMALVYPSLPPELVLIIHEIFAMCEHYFISNT